MRFYYLVLGLVFLASTANAMDLAEMQSAAENNREVIQQYIATLQQSEKEIVKAKSGYLPSVDLGYTANKLNEDTLLEQKENSVFLGKISWNLFAGFRDKYAIKSAEMLQEVEKQKLDGIKQDIRLNVALAYLAVFERRANRTVSESAFQTLEKVYKDGESRYQVGLIGKNELLKFRVDYDNADITFKTADAGLQKSLIDLSRQVGQQIKLDALDFAEFKKLPAPVEKGTYAQKMLAERNEIKVMEAAIAATDAQEGANKSGYFPRVDAVGSYQKYENDLLNGNGSINDEQVRLQVVLSMNLYQGGATEASVAKAKLQARAQRYELEELKHNLMNDLDNVYIDLQVSLDNLPVADRSIEQAEENLRITQLKYDEGLQRESDLLDAITNLTRARYNSVSAVRSVFTNHFRLLRMINGF